MVKKVSTLAIVTLFLFSALSCYAGQSEMQPNGMPCENTKSKISRGVNNLFYGPAEIPENMNQSNTKGTAVEKCNQKTRTGVERGLARIGTGIWQLATFWNSDPGCVTKTSNGKAVVSTAVSEK